MKRILLSSVFVLGVTLAGCGSGNWFGEPEKPPLKGERISVLDYEKDLRPDETAVASSAFQSSEAWQNETWPQAGGTPSHAMQNLALSGKALQKVWSADIGDGSKSRLPLTTQPVVAGQSIFTLDTDAQLSAFAINDGKKRWSIDVRDKTEKDPVIPGGISSDNGFLYVTAGYDELLCVDAQKGDIKWRVKLSSPSRAAPTVSGGRVYVTTMSNSITAFDTTNGAVLWEYAGLGQSTGLIGAASPAATNDLVIPAFSSGEIYALRAGNGSVAWSDNLASSLRLGGMTTLSDIRGLPVVLDDVVYAISFGGKMAAIDLRTGSRIWQKDIAGAKTPWVIGNRVFIITNDGQIVSLNRADGAVIWVSQLARFKDKEDKKGPIFWTGPIFAGNRLLAFSTHGRVAEIDPEKGSLLQEWQTGENVQIAPIIANGTLYILADNGTLAAYR